MVCAANVEYFEKYHLLRGSEYTSIDFSFLILDRFFMAVFRGISPLCPGHSGGSTGVFAGSFQS